MDKKLLEHTTVPGETVTPLPTATSSKALPMKPWDVIIKEEHSLSDVLRWLISASSYDEVKYLIDEMAPNDEPQNEAG